jgi:hypothetical protein
MPGAGILTIASVAALAALSTYIAPSIRHELKVLGVGRTVPVSTIDYVKIQDTIHCEDLHYYAPANILFTACEDRYTRFEWFPPLGNFEPPKEGLQGSFHVIDVEVRFPYPHLLWRESRRGEELIRSTDKEIHPSLLPKLRLDIHNPRHRCHPRPYRQKRRLHFRNQPLPQPRICGFAPRTHYKVSLEGRALQTCDWQQHTQTHPHDFSSEDRNT